MNSHLAVKHSFLAGRRRLEEEVLEELDDIAAGRVKLAADSLLLEVHERNLVRRRARCLAFLELVDDAPVIPQGARDVLERDREQIPLLERERVVRCADQALDLRDDICASTIRNRVPPSLCYDFDRWWWISTVPSPPTLSGATTETLKSTVRATTIYGEGRAHEGLGLTLISLCLVGELCKIESVQPAHRT